MRACRSDLAQLAAITRKPKELAHLAVTAIFQGADLDFQVERTGGAYLVTVFVVRAEEILREVHFPVVWADLDEHARLTLLLFWVTQILASAERTRRRTDAALRAIPNLTSR